MNKKAYIRGKILSAAASVAGIVVLTGGVCYAANVGGIQETVQLWIRGEQVEATVEEDQDGSYVVTYEDENGEVRSMAGGGLEFGPDGSTQTIPLEEYIDHLNHEVTVTTDEDGRLWIYGGESKKDITDLFNICETSIEVDGKTLWVRVEKTESGEFSVWMTDSAIIPVPEDQLQELYAAINPEAELTDGTVEMETIVTMETEDPAE